eukprot:TRINITY_DN2056_c0_g1_i1.p1 TRINITY_DN2056_c0_g1~~TRINITY_DN2056_c0_g1_i1.p1  ORF type:complete len:274 (+),score=50.33 TRINITY_DN2056_c0_g1_i1:115-936(+)
MAATILAAMACATVDFDPKGYYLIKQDLRKCVHPLCGGWWIERVNKRRMRCADGNKAESCYIAEIEGDSRPEFTVFNQERLIKGEFTTKEWEHFGTLGHFVLDSHFASATDAAGTGKYYGVQNNFIQCVTTPCNTYTEYVLNKRKTKGISGIDFGDLATQNADMVSWAQSQLASGEVVIMSGDNRRTSAGRHLVVSQIYQSTKCPEGYSWHKEACRTPWGCAFPEMEHLIVGGAPFTDPVTGEVTSSMTTTCVTECPSHSQPNGPGKCVTFAP